MTSSQRIILITLARLAPHELARLKIVVLAHKTGLSRSTTKRAMKALIENDLVFASRPCTDGPNAVYSFVLTHEGRTLANCLKLWSQYEVSEPRRVVGLPG